jgi:hypothetical protein
MLYPNPANLSYRIFSETMKLQKGVHEFKFCLQILGTQTG